MNRTAPGSKPYPDWLRDELAEAGVTGACLTEQVAADLARHGMLTQVELAGLSYSCSCISMIERGHRTLTRLDHINAVASALRVSPAELAPGVVPGRGERTPAPQVPVTAFPVVRDEITSLGMHA